MAIERAEAKIFDPRDRAHRFKLWVRLGTSEGAFYHFYWRRLAVFLGVSAVAAWLLGAAAIWSLLRYQRGWEAAPYWQVAFMPVRMDTFRLSLGRFYAARGVAEIERRNYLAGRELLLAGLRHARTDLTVRRTVATQLAQIFGLPQRAIDVLVDGLPYDPDLDYLVLTFGWMREARQLTRILELTRRMLPAAPDGTLKHQFIALQEAMVHFDYGRFGEAEQVINAWGLQNSLEGQIVLARCEWERGKEDAALQRLEREISRFAKRDELYAELVRLNRRAGKYEPARRFALLRQFNDPRSAGPRLDLLQGYIDTNEQAAREREVVSYLAMFGGDQVAVLMLARFAAQIGDDAMRVGEGADHAVGAEQRFLLARDDPRLQADRAQLLDEFAPVGRLADGGGGDGLDIADAEIIEQQRKALEPAQGQRHRLVGQPAGSGDLTAQLGGDLLVQQHHRRAHRAAIDDKAHRVGPDVDDRALRRTASDVAGAVVAPCPVAHAMLPRRRESLGTAPASSAPPRPDSDGLVMK